MSSICLSISFWVLPPDTTPDSISSLRISGVMHLTFSCSSFSGPSPSRFIFKIPSLMASSFPRSDSVSSLAMYTLVLMFLPLLFVRRTSQHPSKGTVTSELYGLNLTFDRCIFISGFFSNIQEKCFSAMRVFWTPESVVQGTFVLYSAFVGVIRTYVLSPSSPSFPTVSSLLRG